MTDLDIDAFAAAALEQDEPNRPTPSSKPDLLCYGLSNERTLVTRWNLGDTKPGVTAHAELSVVHMTGGYVGHLRTIAIEGRFTTMNLTDYLGVYRASTKRFARKDLIAAHDSALAAVVALADDPKVLAYFDPARAPK